ncbi:MAG: PAS domain S-box protein [Nitrospirae bacterium]|nr:PAS domain S-box protein [Nitrospirota bacterium]
MKIKTRLRITTGIALGLALFIVLFLVWSFREVSNANRDKDLVSEMRKLAFERIILRDDYLLRHEDRARTQWLAKTEELRKLLDLAEGRFLNSDDRATIKEARDDFNVTFSAFSQVMENRAKYRGRMESALLSGEAEKIILGQVFMKAYALTNDITRLYESAEKNELSARNRAVFIIVLSVFGGIAIVVANLALISRILSKGIAELEQGVAILGEGDLEHRIQIQGNNELAELADASNKMAAKLRDSYTAVGNLQREIENRKLAERGQFRLLNIIEKSLNEIYVFDSETLKFEYLNQGALKNLGYTLSEMTSMTPVDIKPEFTEAAFRAKIRPLMTQDRERLRFETIHRRKNGTEYPVEVHLQLHPEDGKRVFFAIIIDITERNYSEQELRNSEDRFKTIFNEAPLGIAVIDSLNGHIHEVNFMFAKIAGWTREQMLNIDWMSITHPDNVKEDLDNMALLNAGKIPGFQMEKRYLHLDGTAVWINMTISPLKVEDKDRPRHLCMIEDITERKRAEEELRNAETRYRLLFDQSPEGIVIIDPTTTRFLEFNETACRQLGYSREEFAGLSIADLEAEEKPEDTRKRVAKVMVEGRNDYETLQRTRQGEIRNIHVKAQFIDIAGHPVYHCVWSDITEQRRLEAQLLQAQKMESIGILAGGVAHDFNNILSAIIGYGHVTLMKMEENDPQRQNVEHILEATDRAAQLTKSLLLFSRKQISELKAVDLNEVINQVDKFLMRIIGEDISCKKIVTDHPLMVFADRHHLEQVLMNFATNAHDSMPGGGVFTILTEQVDLDEAFMAAHGYGKPGVYAMMTVSDTGSGMDEATRKHIFDPFFTTKEVGKGTGLGLAVVYGIIKQHDGFINLSSEPGKGTTFRIYLPLIASIAEETMVPQKDKR